MVNYSYYEAVRTLVENWDQNRQRWHLERFLPLLEQSWERMVAVMAEIDEKWTDEQDGNDEIIEAMRVDHAQVWDMIEEGRRLLGQDNETFELERVEPQPVAPKGWGSVETETEKSDQEAGTRQAVLFSGLDCLPGQMDLFKTDGGAV